MRRPRLLLLAMLAVSTTACQTAPKKPPPKVDTKPTTKNNVGGDDDSSETVPVGRYYEVQKGDTLWSISRKHGVPPEELAELNGLDAPEMLQVGQLIFLPDDDPLGLPVDESASGDHDHTPDAERATLTTKADLMWPLKEGVLLRDFDLKGTLPHEGILLAAPAGTPVSAAADGHVVHVGEEGAYGMMVILRHSKEAGASDDDHLVTIYTHLDGVDVERGNVVTRGQIIGRVGSSGRAESSQLLFQVREGRQPVDPLAHLPDE